MEGVKDVLDKISSYNLFNYLLPGTLFAFIAKQYVGYDLVQENVLIAVFLYYFVGMIISRLGSLIIQPFLKKIKFVKFAAYEKYIDASKKDAKLDVLSEQNNTYRTLLSMLILLIGLKAYLLIKIKYAVTHDTTMLVLAIALILIFLFAFRKQTKTIVARVDANS